MGKRKDEVRQMPIMVEYRVGGGVAWGEKKKNKRARGAGMAVFALTRALTRA